MLHTLQLLPLSTQQRIWGDVWGNEIDYEVVDSSPTVMDVAFMSVIILCILGKMHIEICLMLCQEVTL